MSKSKSAKSMIPPFESGPLKTVPLSPDQVATMSTMLEVLDSMKQRVNEATARANAHAEQLCAILGIDPKHYNLNWDLKAFVPKPDPAKK